MVLRLRTAHGRGHPGMITPLGFLVTGLMVLSLLGRLSAVRVLAVAGSTAVGSALVAGPVAVPTFYYVGAAVVGVAVLAGLRDSTGPRRVPGPQRRTLSLLAAFATWSLLVTLVAPFLFVGLEVPAPNSVPLAAGMLTTSNIAQIAYLFLGASVVFLVARTPNPTPSWVGLAVALPVVLSLWRWAGLLHGVPFPEGFFDNSPSFAFIESAPGGSLRFRGIFSEPAGLASSAVVALAYMTVRASQVRGWRRLFCALLAAAAMFLGVVSTSATFVVATVVLLGMGAVVSTAAFLGRRVSLGPAVAGALLLVVVGGVVVAPTVYGFVRGVIDAKVGTSSYLDRSSLNSDLVGAFLDTYGLGVGVGSARASSFAPTLLATTGALGSLLFVLLVGSALLGARSTPAARPVVWALVALLTCKVISGPDLSDTTGVLWLGLGVVVALGGRSSGGGGPVNDDSPRSARSAVEVPWQASARSIATGSRRPENPPGRPGGLMVGE